MDHAARVRRLFQDLEAPLLVSDPANLRYLTGFSGSNGFLVLQSGGGTFVTDGRYGEVAQQDVAALPGIELVVYSTGLYDRLAEAIGTADEVQIEADHVAWSFVHRLRDKTEARLRPARGVVEGLRRSKDPEEIAALRAAARAGDAAFARLPSLVRDSLTEAELADGLIAAMRAEGATRANWEPIVAMGAAAARPHHRAGSGPIGAGVLLVDYGCAVDGYHSDMTRTVAIGTCEDSGLKDAWDAVVQANRRGIDAVGPGVKAADVDAACRDALRERGYEEFFVHSTGHGVGLEIHEAPSVRRDSEDVLDVGDVVTVEPGVYLPGRFGVRIEDMVLVTDTGNEVLTASPIELNL